MKDSMNSYIERYLDEVKVGIFHSSHHSMICNGKRSIVNGTRNTNVYRRSWKDQRSYEEKEGDIQLIE